jgi:hypothetical protein
MSSSREGNLVKEDKAKTFTPSSVIPTALESELDLQFAHLLPPLLPPGVVVVVQWTHGTPERTSNDVVAQAMTRGIYGKRTYERKILRFHPLPEYWRSAFPREYMDPDLGPSDGTGREGTGGDP